MNLWIKIMISTHHMINNVSFSLFDKCYKYLRILWYLWLYFFSNICNLIAHWSCQHQNVSLMNYYNDVSTAFLWQKDFLKHIMICCILSFLNYSMFKLQHHSFIYSSFCLLLISQQDQQRDSDVRSADYKSSVTASSDQKSWKISCRVESDSRQQTQEIWVMKIIQRVTIWLALRLKVSLINWWMWCQSSYMTEHSWAWRTLSVWSFDVSRATRKRTIEVSPHLHWGSKLLLSVKIAVNVMSSETSRNQAWLVRVKQIHSQSYKMYENVYSCKTWLICIRKIFTDNVKQQERENRSCKTR